MHNFLPQRAVVMVISSVTPAISLMKEDPGPATLINHRGMNFLTISKADTFDTAAFLENFDNLDPKAEFGSMLACGIGKVLRRQCRIGNVTTIRPVNATFQPSPLLSPNPDRSIRFVQKTVE